LVSLYYLNTNIPREILEEKLIKLKKINKGFERVSLEDFALMCDESLFFYTSIIILVILSI
jgi:hypothetical protein